MTSNLSYYEIFYAVAKNKNISKAAHELFISQPAISKAIKKLEENLSTTLFFRTSRGVELTDDGQLLFIHVDTALSSLHEGEFLLKKNKEIETGHLHIGVSTTLCKYLMLPYLQNFTTAHPHIQITIDCLSSTDTAHLLSENKLDVGLIGNIRGLKNVRFEPLLEIKDTFVTSKQYLNSLMLREGMYIKSPIKELFSHATLMLLDQENISRQHINQYFQDHDIVPGQILESSSMDLLIDFAKVNLGIACVIRDIAKEEIKNGTLIEIPMKEGIPTRTVGFAYSKTAQNNPAVAQFSAFVNPES